MKHLILIILSLIGTINAYAQVDVTGKVIDKENEESLAGASVIIKGSDGKIKKFFTTKGDGLFSIKVGNTDGCRLEVSMMGFAKQTIQLDSASYPLTILLEPGATILKEVAVKADKIKEQGDTISYRVNAFAQTQDRSIGDVLKRMPGINVEKSGKIQYQGNDINKFYIEGSDLLGGKYGIATNGINHEDVGAVEVMENHQPMQVLSGISFSDKAAINLKLKNKAKATWSFHGNAAGGFSCQPHGGIWNGELFAMAIMPGFQNMTTIKTNNSGEDISNYIRNFFTSTRGTDLNKYIGVSLPTVPNLSLKRTLFNRSALISVNSLVKMRNAEFKSQIDYLFKNISADASGITTYFLNDGERIITENRDGSEHSHSLSAKFIYELNQKTTFINNTLRTNLDWDNLRHGVNGSLSNNQEASFPDFYLGNDFKLIRRIKGKHLVTITSSNEWESLPQTLDVSLERNNRGVGIMSQNIRDHAFYTNESVAYAFSISGVTVSFESGIKGYLRSMKSDLTGLKDISGSTGYPENMTNVVNTNYLTLYLTPKFEYWVKRVNLTLNTPASFAHYSFNKTLANRNEVYFSPSLSLNWKPNSRVSLSFRGGTGRSPMNLNLIQPGLVMTNYRSFRQGVDNFYNSSSQNLSSRFSYKYTRYGIFANAFVMQSWSHTPYTMTQQLYGDYIVYSYSPAKSDSKMLITNGSLGKTLDFINGSFNLNGSFNHQESMLISENSMVNSVGKSWSAGVKISGAPLRWIGFDYKFHISSSQLSINSSDAPWLENMENELLINIMPNQKWEWHINGEHYHNELTSDHFKNTFLMDTKLIFKMTKRVEFSVNLSNILNQKTYSYTTYNDLSSFKSLRKLRGREIMMTISIRK